MLGQQVYVENRGGAGGNLAVEAVARAEPDGYTLNMALLSSAVNESLTKNFKYRFEDHFEPVASLAETGLVLLVHPSLEVKSVADLIAMAKAKPGDVLYASAGKGTATHLAAELFNTTAGTKMTAVHYKGGGETIKDLLSGQVKVMFSTIPPVLGFVRDGRLRGIATTAPKRDPALPDLPTIAESGLPGYDVRLWFGLAAPKGTPRAVIDRLAAAVKLRRSNRRTRRRSSRPPAMRPCPARRSNSGRSTRAKSRSGRRWSRPSARSAISRNALRSIAAPLSFRARVGASPESITQPWLWIRAPRYARAPE